MNVAIVDYGSGNLRSAAKAFERAIGEAGLDESVTVTADAHTVRKASRVVLPGVGAFADCMGGLSALPGMLDALDDAVVRNGRPFLGICVGMQLMAAVGREYGETPGLGWIPGACVRLRPADPSLKIPHMGWNDLRFMDSGHPLFDGLDDGAHAYFVHSFGVVCDHDDDVLARVEHGGMVTAVMGRDNKVGTQFHPEKSQAMGLRLITNFLQWWP